MQNRDRKKTHYCRAIIFPVVGPEDGESWEELRGALTVAWQQSTCASNYVITALAKCDVVRSPEMTKLPKMPKVYLYPEVRKILPEMDPQSVCSLLQSVTAKYSQSRYAVIWRGAASLPTYRYPQPYPIHNQSWDPVLENDRPCISVRLQGQRWKLRLRGGPDFHRQRSAFLKMLSGEAICGELSFYRKNANAKDGRNGIKQRKAGGGQRQHYRVMAKLVGWFPRSEQVKTGRTMQLVTGGGHFWAAYVEGRSDPWILNADHLRKWIVDRDYRKQRIAEDLKREKRFPKHMRQLILEASQKEVWSRDKRLRSFCHEITASVASFASRQRVDIMVYDDSNQGYMPHFPWFELKEMLIRKLDERGIILVASSEVKTESREALAIAE